MRVRWPATNKEKNEPDATPFGYVSLGWDIQSRGDDSGGNDMTTVIVRAGDSLWSIAQNNQTSVEALQAANPQLRNPNLLRVGESLSLPQDSFERTGQGPTELSQSDFLKRFQGPPLTWIRSVVTNAYLQAFIPPLDVRIEMGMVVYLVKTSCGPPFGT